MRLLVAIFVGTLAVGAAPAPAAVHRMFVTSTSGTGRLGSWPDAGAHTGLAAGDAICRARAAAAGIPGAASFVAWLSDSVDDAYCRVHGLTGKKSANCGEPTLPDAAGPWRRVGGTPFGPDIARLLDPFYETILPPRLDENAAAVSGNVWTGTGFDGAVFAGGFHCADWTSDAGPDFGSFGETDDIGKGWLYSGSYACSTANLHLVCLQPGVGDPLPPLANWGRLAFVSSVAGTGNLASWPQAGGETGIAAGDAICRNLATAAGLANADSFKAWLSSATVDARDRFDFDGPWIRPDRARLAASLADLTDGDLNTAIDIDENGVFVASQAVWTGTFLDGTADTDRCADWTSEDAADSGDGGLSDSAAAHWTAFVTRSCDTDTNRIYCLQDLPLIFADGFESEDTSAWSLAVP